MAFFLVGPGAVRRIARQYQRDVAAAGDRVGLRLLQRQFQIRRHLIDLVPADHPVEARQHQRDQKAHQQHDDQEFDKGEIRLCPLDHFFSSR